MRSHIAWEVEGARGPRVAALPWCRGVGPSRPQPPPTGTAPILYSLLADLVLALHLAFIVFVVVGGFVALRWPEVAWVHVPCAAWGALVELAGWVCPLTPLENRLRAAAGEVTYAGGFIERYLTAAIYPSGLTREVQVALGVAVVVVNAVAYGLLLRRRRKRRG